MNKLKIVKAEIFKVEIPIIHPFKTSFGTITNRPMLIIKIFDIDGNIGYGECSALEKPIYSYETTDTAILILKDFLIPDVIGKEVSSPDDLKNIFKPIKGHNFAKASLDMAFWSLYSTIQKKSLMNLLGGVRDKVPVGKSVGIKSGVKETFYEIEKCLDEGYKRIKLKIQHGWDVEIVKAVRDRFGDIMLTADANSSYTLKDIKTFSELDKYNLAMIEQPFAEDDIIDHATLQKKISTPICLDESILSTEDARKAIEIGACKIINIKTGRVGGVTESKRIHDICKEMGVPVWSGGMMESGIGRAFNIALSSLPNFSMPGDHTPYDAYYPADLVKNPFRVEDGFIQVPSKPGLGFEVSEENINKYLRNRLIIGG